MAGQAYILTVFEAHNIAYRDREDTSRAIYIFMEFLFAAVGCAIGVTAV